MSIATVVTRGYGTGSYADVSKLPTLGYSIGTAAEVYADRCEYTISAQRMEFTIPAQRMEYTVQR